MHAKKIDKLATGILYTIAGIIVAILASLLLYILLKGLPHVNWSFLTGKSSSYQAGGGIGIQLYNSLFLLVITLIISIPLSMGAGIYLSEYAKKWAFLQISLELVLKSYHLSHQLLLDCLVILFCCSISIWFLNYLWCPCLNRI